MAEFDLKTALGQVSRKRMSFALYKGDKDDGLIVTPKAPSSKQVAGLEKDCGKVKPIAKGVCYFQDGTFIFATKSAPSPAWKAAITGVLKKNQCAKYLPVELRQLGEDESEEGSAEDESERAENEKNPGGSVEPVPAAPPAGPAAREEGAPAAPPAAEEDPLQKKWVAIKAALLPRVKTVVAADPPNKTQILTLLKGASDKEKAGEFAAALDFAKQIAAELASASRAAPAAPPGSSPSSSGPSAPELMAELNRLAPEIKAQVAADPACKEKVVAPAAAFQAHLKAGRLEEAAEALQAVKAALAESRAKGDKLERALTHWASARGQVVEQLKSLEKAIRAMKDPEGDQAIVLVKSIQSNLTVRPATLQQLAELENYFSADDVVVEAEQPNGFGLKIDIRGPLMPILGEIRSGLAA